MVDRPPLRYYGAKFRLAPRIIAHFPPHECYVEPFGGAAGVLLRKPPAPVEVYNDREGEVVNFFRVLRDQPEALVRALQLTPYARQEVRWAHAGPATADPVERARRFYVISWQQFHGAKVGARNGWRYARRAGRGKRNPMDQWRTTRHLYAAAARLRTVFIECDDALQVMARFDGPGTLHYADPPYLGATRHARWREKAYLHDMPGAQAHRQLAEALRALEGMVVLSGYPSALYDEELYPDWPHVDLAGKNAQGQATTERLWLNPQAAAARDRMQQLAFGL